MDRFLTRLAAFAVLLISCSARAEEINVTLLHLNDVYEITAVQGGKRGGLARVATLRKELKRLNPNTFTILGGDAVSPSALGTAVIDGEPLAGKQMIATLNAVGIDYATFGNHEFDLTQQRFLDRLTESRFAWLSSNVTDPNGHGFPAVPDDVIVTVKGKTGVFRIGLMGITIDSNPKDFVAYHDPIKSARQQVEKLKGRVDAIVAITHLDLDQDIALATAVPEIDLILGGHEHENVQVWRGGDLTPILKADANVRSVYVVEMKYNTTRHSLVMNPRLKEIDEEIKEDPAVAREVKLWVDRAFDAFRSSGFKPDEVIARSAEPLDGREAAIRNGPTNLGALIARALVRQFPTADLAFYNSGSIRIDDVVPPGPLSQYDVIRILPFGGRTMLAEMSGSVVQRALTAGVKNKGVGGYLQTANVSQAVGGDWLVNGDRIDPDRMYRVATNEFLLTGRETGLEFLRSNSMGLGSVTPGSDIRFSLIAELRAKWPGK